MSIAMEMRSDLGYVIVGSAPGAIEPDATFAHHHTTIAANGGGALCAQWGIPVGYLCTTSHLFRHSASEAERLTAGSLWNLPVSHSVFIDIASSPEVSMRIHSAINCSAFSAVDKNARREVVLDALRRGGDRWAFDSLRVSTGVWAVCLAVASGSPRVLVTGIDPDSQGHCGIEADGPPRDHVAEDRAVLGALEAAGLVEVLR
jgi:hypothetical protein